MVATLRQAPSSNFWENCVGGKYGEIVTSSVVTRCVIIAEELSRKGAKIFLVVVFFPSQKI